MNLTVKRTIEPDGTPGEMFIEGIHECYTLELPNKDGLPGSCIPQGTYKVVLTESDEFGTDAQFVALTQRLTVLPLIPRIIGIPNRTLIDIHWGNTEANTRGCVLVGETQDGLVIGSSRAAFAKLYPKIVFAVRNEGCWITMIGGFGSALEDAQWPGGD